MAPNAYDVDAKPQRVEVKEEGVTYEVGNTGDNIFYNKPTEVEVELTKVDKENTSLKLPGASFVVYKTDKDGNYSEGDEVGKLKDEDNDGIYAGKLRYGNYALVEEKAPEGYEKASEPYKFSVDSKNKVIIKNEGNYFTNNKIKGHISITKVEEGNTSKKLSGAEFTIYKDNGNGVFNLPDDIEVGKMTDLSDGKYEYKDLEYGTYWVKETKAPAGYKIDTKKSDSNGAYKVVIDTNNETKSVSNAEGDLFENTLIKGTVKIVKVDAENTDQKLSEATFKVYKKTDLGEQLKGTLIESDTEAGVYSISLPEGEYVLREETAPIGFKRDISDHPFKITESTDIINITNDTSDKNFENSPIKGTIVINKVASNDKALKTLPGAVFEVYKESNNNGKLDENDKLVDTIRDVAGKYISSELKYGKYFVKEVQAPIGYVKDQNPCEVNIISDNDVKIASNKNNNYFENDIIQGKVKIIKVDKDYPENKLSGAVFEVYKDVNKSGTYENETDILVGTLNEDEKEKGSYYKELSYGKYLLKEKTAPEGFIVDAEYHPFEIAVNNNEVLVETKAGENFVNTCIKGTLELTKVDEDYPENKLSGAEFKVYNDADKDGQPDSDKEVCSLRESTQKGVYTSEKLRFGNYVVKETKAPEGFVLDEKYHKVKISVNDEVVPVETEVGKNFVNKKSTISIYDGDDKPYQGKDITNKYEKGDIINKPDDNISPQSPVTPTTNSTNITNNNVKVKVSKIKDKITGVKTSDNAKLGILISIAAISFVVLVVMSISHNRKKKDL